MLRPLSVIFFVAGLIVGVRVMFFGVQLRQGTRYVRSRVWPFALAVFLLISGVALYLRGASAGGLGRAWLIGMIVTAAIIAALAWIVVRRSATAPSTDPEDDPKYRFQGHIARVTELIGSGPAATAGRIAFDFDGRGEEFPARWTAEADALHATAAVNDDVVIERVEDGVAYVEPWSIVENRL